MDYTKAYHFILVLILYWPQQVYLYYYPTIYWSPNNCRFNLNKPDQPQTFYFKVKPSSHLFFVCPHVALWQDMASTSPHLRRMYENIMMVDQHGYNTCTVNKTRDPKLNREMLRCDNNPMKLKYMEEILSPDRAFIDEVKYTLGHHYYFISTSDGTLSSLDNTAGGHCTSHHMKLHVYLCKKDEPCEFEMPKCPFTDVFHNANKQTTQPAAPPTTAQSTLNMTSADVATMTSQRATTTVRRKEERPVHVKETMSRKELTTEIPHSNVDALGQTTETLWGKDRKHIIIHITMALVILILLLCLIYIWISRRKPFLDSKKNKGIDSELYRQRPVSVQQPSESEPFSRQHGVATHCV